MTRRSAIKSFAAGSWATVARRSATEPSTTESWATVDLTRFDEGYFSERLILFVQEAGRQGIVVELTLFDDCRSSRAFADSLYAPSNNVNALGLAPGDDPHGDATLSNPLLLSTQEAYVAHVLEATKRVWKRHLRSRERNRWGAMGGALRKRWLTMRVTLEKFHIGGDEFTVEFDSGGSVGGEISVFVSDRSGQVLLVRTFYFESSERHIRRFARKFAEDAAYRKDCLDGTVRWARLAEWYERNEQVYWQMFQTIKAASTPEKLREMTRQKQWTEKELRRLYRILDAKLEELEALPEYQEHLRLERQTPEPSMDELDPSIARAVMLLNHLPGVVTRFSCEGIRQGTTVADWEHGPIWFPGKHMPFAHVIFASIPSDLEQELDDFLQQRGVGCCRFGKAESQRPECNAEFVQALEEFAEHRIQ